MASDTDDGSNGGGGGDGGGRGRGAAANAVAGTTSPDLYYLVMRAWLSVDGGLGHNRAGGGGRREAVPPPHVPGPDGTSTFVVAIGDEVVVVIKVGGWRRRNRSGQVLQWASAKTDLA